MVSFPGKTGQISRCINANGRIFGKRLLHPVVGKSRLSKKRRMNVGYHGERQFRGAHARRQDTRFSKEEASSAEVVPAPIPAPLGTLVALVVLDADKL